MSVIARCPYCREGHLIDGEFTCGCLTFPYLGEANDDDEEDVDAADPD
jgi:hypothetical protein